MYCVFMRFFCFLPVLVFFLVSCSSEDKSSSELYDGVLSGGYDGRGQSENGEDEELYVLMIPQGADGGSGSSDQISDLFNGTTNCENCSPSLGYLITKEILTDQGPVENIVLTDFCQGYLLNDDVFLVVLDCLPETLRSVGDSCEDEIQVIVPQSDSQYPMVFGCDELLSLPSTDIDLLNNDFQLNWAALRLKER